MGRNIPIFAPEQLNDEMKKAWEQASTSNPPAWLECSPLRNENGSVACAGPVGWIYVDAEGEVKC